VPIGHEVFPGNTHDAKAFAALLTAFKERSSSGRVMLCTDRCMVLGQILGPLRRKKIKYMVGSRLHEAKAALAYQ
jgi:transposase